MSNLPESFDCHWWRGRGCLHGCPSHSSDGQGPVLALVALVTLVALMGAGMGVGLVWVLAMEVTVGCDFVWRGEGTGDHSISAGSTSGHLGVAAA